MSNPDLVFTPRPDKKLIDMQERIRKLRFWLTLAYVLPIFDLGFPAIGTLLISHNLPFPYALAGLGSFSLITAVVLAWKNTKYWLVFTILSSLACLGLTSAVPFFMLLVGSIVAIRIDYRVKEHKLASNYAIKGTSV